MIETIAIVRECCAVCAARLSLQIAERGHGEACTLARSVLRKFTSVPLEMLAETRVADAVLCYSCENKLTSVHNLEIKLTEVKVAMSVVFKEAIRQGCDGPPPKVARIASSSQQSSGTPLSSQVSLGVTGVHTA